MSALDTQVGGGHYKDLPIQPVTFIHANNIPFLESNVIKYIVRHKTKNGAADIQKAIHYCQLILELEYGKGQGPESDNLRTNQAVGNTTPVPPNKVRRLKLDRKSDETAEYLEKGISARRIASLVGCTEKTLALWMTKRLMHKSKGGAACP